MPERVQIFKDILQALKNNKVVVRMIRFHVPNHKERYSFPAPEYSHSLMLFLERCCDYLDRVKDSGVVFGDYEQDEINSSVLDFSQFKQSGTKHYFGRSLGRLIDTIYFTHSHYSRFMQAADMICFLCQRYESDRTYDKWHDNQLKDAWGDLKNSIDYLIQDWP